MVLRQKEKDGGGDENIESHRLRLADRKRGAEKGVGDTYQPPMRLVEKKMSEQPAGLLVGLLDD